MMKSSSRLFLLVVAQAVGGSACGVQTETGPSPACRCASATLRWIPPRFQSDGLNFLDDLRTHEIRYGTAPGDYPFALRLDTVPGHEGVPLYTLSELEPDATYYAQVRAIDEDGNASAWSEEVSFTAAVAAERAEPEWTAQITSLPFDCDAAGGRYVVSGDLGLALGEGITISAPDVSVYGGNGYYGSSSTTRTFTYGTSGLANAFVLTTEARGFEIYGFRFQSGGFDSGGTATHRLISYGGALPEGGRFHDNHVIFDHVPNVGIGGGDGRLSNLMIYRNTFDFAVNGPLVGAGRNTMRFLSESSDWWAFDNTINFGVIQYYNGFSYGATRAYAFRNTVNTRSDSSQGAPFYTYGGSDRYLANNVVHAKGEGLRPFHNDGGCQRTWILWNRVDAIDPNDAARANRLISTRFGSDYLQASHNRLEITGENLSLCFSGPSSNSNGYGTVMQSSYIYFHHNELFAPGRPAMTLSESMDHVYVYRNAISADQILLLDGGMAPPESGPSSDIYFENNLLELTNPVRVNNYQWSNASCLSFAVVDDWTMAEVGGVGGYFGNMTFPATALMPETSTVPAPPTALTSLAPL